jgi:hypothetical protein
MHRPPLLLVGLLVLAAATPAPVAAQADDDFVELDITDESGPIDSALAAVGGIWARTTGSASSWLTDVRDAEPTPSEQTEDLKTYLNERNETFIASTNQVLTEYDASIANATYVLELTVENTEGDTTESSTIYVVAEADGENVTSARVYDDTNATVDRSRTLSWDDAKLLNEDVRDYYDTYAEPGEVPPKSYLIGLASTYGNVSEITVSQA